MSSRRGQVVFGVALAHDLRLQADAEPAVVEEAEEFHPDPGVGGLEITRADPGQDVQGNSTIWSKANWPRRGAERSS